MSCSDRDEELNAFLDGELSVEKAAALTLHLAACPDCASKLADLARLREALARALPKQEPSADLRARVEALLKADAPAKRFKDALPFRPRSRGQRLAWIGGGAAIAAALVLAFLHPHDESRELMAVRDASLRNNLTERAVNQKAAPLVQGFTIAAARADIVAGHQAQVLVYKGAGDTITLCIWPANGEPAHDVRSADYQGTEINYWNDGKNEFWAASATPGPTLNAFVHALRTS